MEGSSNITSSAILTADCTVNIFGSILRAQLWADELQAIIEGAPEGSDFLTYDDVDILFGEREVIFDGG